MTGKKCVQRPGDVCEALVILTRHGSPIRLSGKEQELVALEGITNWVTRRDVASLELNLILHRFPRGVDRDDLIGNVGRTAQLEEVSRKRHKVRCRRERERRVLRARAHVAVKSLFTGA